MAFEHLAQLTGCAASALILQDICGRHEASGRRRTRWSPLDLALSARAPVEVLELRRNHAGSQLLKRWLRLGSWFGRSWARTSATGPTAEPGTIGQGPNCPEFLLGKPSRTRRSNPVAQRHAQSKRQPLPKPPTKTGRTPKTNSPRKFQMQGHPAAGIEAEEAMVFVPAPAGPGPATGTGNEADRGASSG